MSHNRGRKTVITIENGSHHANDDQRHGHHKGHKSLDYKLKASGFIKNKIKYTDIQHYNIYESDKVVARDNRIVVLCKCGKELASFYKFACFHFHKMKVDSNFVLKGENSTGFKLSKPIFLVAKDSILRVKHTGDTHENFLKDNFGELSYRLIQFYTNHFTSIICHSLNTIMQGTTDERILELYRKYNPEKFKRQNGLKATEEVICTEAQFNYISSFFGVASPNSQGDPNGAGAIWCTTAGLIPNAGTSWDVGDEITTSVENNYQGTVESLMVKVIASNNSRGLYWDCLSLLPQGRQCNFYNPDFRNVTIYDSSSYTNFMHFFDPSTINIGDPDQNIPPDPNSQHISCSIVISPFDAGCLGVKCQNNTSSTFYAYSISTDPRAVNTNSDPNCPTCPTTPNYTCQTDTQCTVTNPPQPGPNQFYAFSAPFYGNVQTKGGIWKKIWDETKDIMTDAITDMIIEAILDTFAGPEVAGIYILTSILVHSAMDTNEIEEGS